MGRPTLERKVCTSCGKEKKITQFSKSNRVKSGYASTCKKCDAKKSREYRKRNKDKVKEYNNSPERVRRNYETKIQRKYGLEMSDIERMLEEQDHKCAICRTDIGVGADDYTAVVDHSHFTGEIRGLLCNWCNRGLGHYEDSPSLFKRAAEYLEETAPRPNEKGNEGRRTIVKP